MIASARSVWLLLLALALPAAAGAQPAAEEGKEPLREKTIYVPYDRLSDVFEKEGRGIFLPYKEFLELWQRAQPRPEPPKPEPPPAEAVISGGLYKGSVEGDLARFQVEYDVRALKKEGWSTLLLPLKSAAVESAAIDVVEIPAEGETRGEAETPAEEDVPPPPLLAGMKDHYAVYLPGPGSYRIRIELAVRVTAQPGRRHFTFGIPPAAVSRLDLVIPEENAQLRVEPLVAATRIEEREGATRVLAFVGNADSVTVSWSPPAGKIEEERALLLANQKVRAYLGERVLRVSTDVQLQILRATVSSIRVRTPAEMEVFSVDGENIREWRTVEEREDAAVVKFLELTLHSGVENAYQFRLAFERILRTTPTSLEVPFPRVDGVLRESGYVALGHDSGLNVRVAGVEGLSQQDLSELPEDLRQGTLAGFRYLAHPLRLALEIEKIEPVIRSDTTSVVIFGVDEDLWIGWIDYRITRSGVFSLRIQVPSRWQAAPFDESLVEDYQSAPAENDPASQVITVNLRNRAFGNFRLPFRLTAEGSAAAGEKTVRAPRPLGVASDRGLLGIGGPREFAINEESLTGAIPADRQELYRTGIRSRIPQNAIADLAFTYHAQPASVEVRLEAKKTEVRVSSRILANVTYNDIKVSQDLEYLIEFAAIDRIAFSAPANLEDRLQFEVSGKRSDQREAVEGDRMRWEITLQSKVIGPVTVKITYTEDLSDIEEGASLEKALPLIRAEGAEVRGEEGTVAIRKEGALEVEPRVEGLEVIDPRELPPELARGRIYAAYRFSRPEYRLALNLTRHQYVPMPDAAVQTIAVVGHLSRERILDADAVLQVENSGRQYLDLHLPEGADSIRVFVGGREARVSRQSGEDGEPGDLRIPLRGASGTVLVWIRYRLGLGGAMGSMGSFRFEAPEVRQARPEDRIPVGKVAVELHLPRGYDYITGGGSLYPQSPRVRGSASWLWQSLFSTPVVEAQGVRLARWYRFLESPPVPRNFPDLGERVLLLETHDPRASLSFYYVEGRYFTALNILVFLAALALGIWAVVTFRRERWWIATVGAAVFLLLGWLASPGVDSIFLSAFRAGALLIVGLAFRDAVPPVRAAWERWRAERLELAPDPFLEPAAKPARRRRGRGEKETPGTAETPAPGKPDVEESDAVEPEKPAGKTPRKKKKKGE